VGVRAGLGRVVLACGAGMISWVEDFVADRVGVLGVEEDDFEAG